MLNWIDKKQTHESLAILGTLSQKCSELGGPLCRELNALVQKGDYKSLVNYEIKYSLYDFDDLKYGRQILGFYQKLDILDLGLSKSGAAAKRFIESEVMCRQTNRRLQSTRLSPQTVDSDIHRVLSIAVWKIGKILGDLPSLEAFEFAFGPGANTNVKGALACPRAKLSAQLECSTDLSPTVQEFLYEVPVWTALHATQESEDSYVATVRVVPGKVIFVPKNAKTDRSIVVEPPLNSFFQKGVGSYIRERLMHSKINLRDQSRNQNLACKGSVDGSLATVDLSMASDCLSRELVWDLLPYDWANLLSSLRTSEVLVPQVVELQNLFTKDLTISGESVLKLEKFSSMGNGYTFELESLIFYGLAYGVCRDLNLSSKDVSVYGDDIIIPTSAYPLLEKVLQFCGFSVNKEKSFADGQFRESCGADYLNGFDIRPFYQKTQINEAGLYVMHNWFVRHGEYELSSIAADLCSPHLLLRGPDNFGDGHLIGSFELRQNREVKRRGWDGGYFDTYSLKSRSFTGVLPGDAVLPVYSVYTRSGKDSPTDPNVVRGSSGYARISIYTLQRSIFSGR